MHAAKSMSVIGCGDSNLSDGTVRHLLSYRNWGAHPGPVWQAYAGRGDVSIFKVSHSCVISNTAILYSAWRAFLYTTLRLRTN